MILEHSKSIVIAGALTLTAAGPLSSAAAAPESRGASPREGRALEALLPEPVERVLLPGQRVSPTERRVNATYQRLYTKVRREEGREAPGRNIVEHGVRRGGEVRAARRTEVERSIGELRAFLGAPAPGGAARAQAAGETDAGATGGAASGTLEAIAACESGGNASAVGGGGAYGGKYQFDRSTWQSVGGSGDPASASESEQDSRAAQLYAQQGASAWPTCG